MLPGSCRTLSSWPIPLTVDLAGVKQAPLLGGDSVLAVALRPVTGTWTLATK